MDTLEYAKLNKQDKLRKFVDYIVKHTSDEELDKVREYYRNMDVMSNYRTLLKQLNLLAVQVQRDTK